MPDEIDGHNILDDATMEVVSDNIADWTFEQVLGVTNPIPKDERSVINFRVPRYNYSVAAIRDLARSLSTSFTVVTRVALPHGFSIYSRKWKDSINTLNALDSAALDTENQQYFNFRMVRPTIDLNRGEVSRRIPVVTSHALADAIGNQSAILGTSISHLVGYCILLSLVTSDTINPHAKTHFQKYINGFEYTMQLTTDHAVKLL